ncbi:MAG TPA: carboxypeptidase regulatory-like domain-containing protein, partial [Chitinophagaceae bacterium]|nr:carboxypeptidase regulatory-like domain-containing protein [Chitinophagaceae bacterium]
MINNKVTLRATCYALIILFILEDFDLNAQQTPGLVKGTVTNDRGEPLPGVSVIVKNQKNNYTTGTNTDSAGVFSFQRLSAGGPYTFTFSAVGFETQPMAGYTIRDDNDLSLSVQMKSSATNLDQVVVVGYGTQLRKDLTGSVASVGTKDIRDLAVNRIDQALLGKVAGVQVKPVSGEPGAAPQIRIRGIGSISA